MRDRLIQLVLTLLVSVSFLGPAFETVDCWDHFMQGGDIVLTVLGLGILCGLVLTLVRTLLVRLSSSCALGIVPKLSAEAAAARPFASFLSSSAQPPPVSLRI